MKIRQFTWSALLLAATLQGCQNNQRADQQNQADSTHQMRFSDEELMTKIQKQTFRYFWEGAEPTSGLARERIHMDGDYPQNDEQVITTGGSGLGIMGIIVAMERDFIR